MCCSDVVRAANTKYTFKTMFPKQNNRPQGSSDKKAFLKDIHRAKLTLSFAKYFRAHLRNLSCIFYSPLLRVHTIVLECSDSLRKMKRTVV